MLRAEQPEVIVGHRDQQGQRFLGRSGPEPRHGEVVAGPERLRVIRSQDSQPGRQHLLELRNRLVAPSGGIQQQGEIAPLRKRVRMVRAEDLQEIGDGGFELLDGLVQPAGLLQRRGHVAPCRERRRMVGSEDPFGCRCHRSLLVEPLGDPSHRHEEARTVPPDAQRLPIVGVGLFPPACQLEVVLVERRGVPSRCTPGHGEVPTDGLDEVVVGIPRLGDVGEQRLVEFDGLVDPTQRQDIRRGRTPRLERVLVPRAEELLHVGQQGTVALEGLVDPSRRPEGDAEVEPRRHGTVLLGVEHPLLVPGQRLVGVDRSRTCPLSSIHAAIMFRRVKTVRWSGRTDVHRSHSSP